MRVWSVLKKLSLKEFFQLAGLMLQNPLYILPTLKATKLTLEICNASYADTHHLHGKANAFRHALWNVLICQKTFKITKNDEKSIIWAQKVTDLHEELAPNEPLEKAMDLHNNQIGRFYFASIKGSSEEEIILFLKEKAQKGKKIIEIKDILDHQSNLVYLSEE
ncbi:DUF6973 domain-containing protein [Aquimarina mytili]|uniref:DUF6973 domain-containing protein n=1 Tax=Aquimarina mytili TaxID=874423 RepID=A0A937DA93_9FLAO|nr:hypothetical protein [Aquimarina mytili]MBL0684522.1 hypothetical protein [Aquimarina mytili]